MNNPNNCAVCDHKRHPDGGWCYMFRDEPQAACAKHTAMGVHWLGGRPYMLTSEAPAPKQVDVGLKTRSQRMREAGFTRRPSAKNLPTDE